MTGMQSPMTRARSVLPCVSQCSRAREERSESANPHAWDSATTAEFPSGDAMIALAMHVGGPLLCTYQRSAPAPVAGLPFLLHVPPSKNTSYGTTAALLVGANALGTESSSPATMERRANKQASCLPQCRHREVNHSQFALASCAV